MSRIAHTLWHGFLVVLQGANATLPILPGPWRAVAAAALALVQAIMAIYNHGQGK